MVTGIILASGFSKRMQQNKLLLPFEGIPLVEHVLRAAVTSCLDECILVFREAEVESIGKKYGLQTVYNELADQGQSAAVKLGVVKALEEVSGYLFLVGDQPYLSSEIIDAMVESHKKHPDKILAALHKGRRGNPVLFPNTLKEELLNINGDIGGRQIMKQFPDKVIEIAFNDEFAGIDVDTPEKYKQLFPKE